MTLPLRVLHVGSGFRPWRRGGLVAYVDDLTAEQARRGQQVFYLFSGRQYPLLRGPRLKRWRRDGVEMLEIVNSPLFDHGRQPELEVAEPRVERIFAGALAEVRPDVVHFQELAGMPFSVLDVARHAGVPTVLTLQDYFALCSTFKLLDASGQVCVRRRIGEDCVATVAADPRPPHLLFDATIRYELERRAGVRRLSPQRREKLVGLSVRLAARGYPPAPAPPPDAAAFQRRRDVNVARLNAVERLVAMSPRVAELHRELGVQGDRLRTLRLTLAHIEALRHRMPSSRLPVTFATLGGGESVAKGSRLLLEATRRLSAEAPGAFRLLVFGHVTAEARAAARSIPEVEVRGGYAPEELDALLEEVDVGIMPSIWEEAYGYAGVEFLAKAIPVVGNARGGIVDYVHDGETGWLNRSCTAAGLTAAMRGIVAAPEQVAHVSARLRERRDGIVLPFSSHVEEMDAVYREAIAVRRAGAPG